MRFGKFTDNKEAKEFFKEQIEYELEDIKERFGQGEYRKYLVKDLEKLRDNIYGLRDSFGLFTTDTIKELSAPVMEMLSDLSFKIEDPDWDEEGET